MTASGFTVAEALMVHRQMGEIVIGAAVILLQVRALEQVGHPFEQAALKVLDPRAGEVPLLARQSGSAASCNFSKEWLPIVARRSTAD